MKTATEIFVLTIDKERLIEKLIEEYEYKLEKNQVLRISCDAILLDNDKKPTPVFVDQDCCYGFMNKHLYHNNKIQYAYFIGVHIDEKNDHGITMKNIPEFFIPLAEENFEDLSKEVLTLHEYMGTRYNYNPRIAKNTREFLTDICSQL